MANLSEETLNTVFNLQRQLFQVINEATAIDYNLTEMYRETEATLLELEELQNIKERARDSYNRLSRLVLMIGEAQPIASQDTLDLLYRSIEQTEAMIYALNASIQEIKKKLELTMNQEKKIPDAETRAKSVKRLKEVCLMLDALNMTLDEAIASAEADIRNNPHNIRKREKAQRLFDLYKQQ